MHRIADCVCVCCPPPPRSCRAVLREMVMQPQQAGGPPLLSSDLNRMSQVEGLQAQLSARDKAIANLGQQVKSGG